MQFWVKILHQQKDYRNEISSKDPSSTKNYRIVISNKVGARTFCGFMVPLLDCVSRVDVVGTMAFWTIVLLPKLRFSFPTIPWVGLVMLPIIGSASFLASSCPLDSFAHVAMYHPQAWVPWSWYLTKTCTYTSTPMWT